MRPPSPNSSSQKKLALPESIAASAGDSIEPWFDDTSVLDTDHFAKTLSNIKAKNIHPDLLASIISHYATKWLPELSGSTSASASSPKCSTATWLKKRFFVEALVNILPPEKDSMPCDFLLRLLRLASMVGAGAAYLEDLETRVAWQLDRASLKDVMIPAFSHTCGTLLDVGLVLRLIKRFVGLDEAGRSGVAMVKVAKLVDSYLAEVALDAGLTLSEFEELARALPSHARAVDDGLYRAMDTFIKAHPSTTKQEKKNLCRLIDTRKLTPEASLHAVHNDRLPVRSVIQILFSEPAKVNRFTEWTGGSFSGSRSPNVALEASGRSSSKREVLAQQQEMRKLREDVGRLRAHCCTLQAQIDKLNSEKKKKGFLKWSSLLFRNADSVDKVVDDYEAGLERRTPRTPRTPMNAKKATSVHGTGTPPKWRNSLS